MVRRVNSLVRLTARLLVLLSSGLALLVAVILSATQFQPTRSAALSAALDLLNSQLAGRVSIGEMTGNILSEVTLHDVVVTGGGSHVVNAPVIEVRYQLSPIFRERIIGARIRFINPTITLVRDARSGQWNFAQIVRPSTAIDTTTTPFEYIIDLAEIEIRDGRASVDDRTTPVRTDVAGDAVDWDHIEIGALNLSAVARIEPRRTQLLLQHLSFALPRNDVHVIDICGDVSADSNGIRLAGLGIETEGSRLTLDATLDSVDLLGGDVDPGSWSSVPVALQLHAARISTAELSRFLPPLSFLGGTPEIDLVATGTYGEVEVERLHVAVGETNIELAGTMRHLDRPNDLTFDVRMTDSRILGSDVTATIPGISLPDLTPYGDVRVDLAEYRGDVRSFHCAVQAQTAIGSLRGAGHLDLRGTEIKYQGDVELASFNLAPIVADDGYRTNFNGRIIVSGSGTSQQTADVRFQVLSEESMVMARSYRQLVLQGTYRQAGLLRIDTAVAVLGQIRAAGRRGAPGSIDEYLRGNSVARLTRRAGGEIEPTLFAAGPSIGLSGELDIRNQSVPRYSLSVVAHRASVADFVPGASTDRFSFSGSVSGVGIDPDEIDGRTTLVVSEVVMADGRRTDPFQLDARLERLSGNERRFTLQSSIADVSITGEWRFTSVAQSLARALEGLANYVQRKATYRAGGELGFGRGDVSNERVAAVYSLRLRDLRPLTPFLGGASLEAVGELNGTITGTPNMLTVDVGGSLARLRYESDGNELLMGTVRVKTAEIRNLSPSYIDEFTAIDINLAVDSPFVYNGSIYAVSSCQVALAEGVFRIDGNGGIPGQLLAAVSAVVDTRNAAGYVVAVDNLWLVTTAGQSWQNVGPIRGLIADREIRIDTLRLRRKKAETVSLSGSFVDNKELRDVRIRVEGATVMDLTDFTSSTPFYNELKQGRGRFTDLELDASGTLDNPSFALRLTLDSLAFAHTAPSRITLDLHYADRNLSGTGVIEDLFGNGAGLQRVAARIDATTIPIDLAIASRTRRLLQDRPVDVVARTDSLPLSMFSPFLSGAQVSSGSITTRFAISGRLPEITYRGDGTIDRGRIRLESTNVTYLADGELEFTERRLTVKRLTVRNLPADLRDGSAEISGYVNLVAFTPKDFELKMSGKRLLVLSDATQAVNNQLYGNLVISIPGLTFSGPSFASPRVGGTVVVIEASLKAEQAGGEATIHQINYVDYADWLRQRERGEYGPEIPSAFPDSARNRRSDGPPDQVPEIPFDTAVSPPGVATGFYDRLEMRNLFVAIRAGTLLTIDFSPFQQLRASLETAAEKPGLVLNKKALEELTVAGDIQVVQGSKFVFFKPFEARGELQFNGPIANPKLSVVADYTGRQLQTGTDLTREYVVSVRITGTVNKPQIDLWYEFVGDNTTPVATDRETQQRNALSLLLFGRTIEQLGSTSLGEQVGNVAGTVGESGLSIVSSTLSNILAGGTDFIRSVDITGSATDIGQARVNLVSQFGKVVVRAGGRVSNPTADGTVTVDIPVDIFFDDERLRNLVLQLERAAQTTQSSSVSSATGEDQETYRVRIQYRVVW